MYDLSELITHLLTFGFNEGFAIEQYEDNSSIPNNWPDGKINSFIIVDQNEDSDNIEFNDFNDLSLRTITQDFRIIAHHEKCKSDIVENVINGLTSFVGTSAEMIELTSGSTNSASIIEALFGEKPTTKVNVISIDFSINYSPKKCVQC